MIPDAVMLGVMKTGSKDSPRISLVPAQAPERMSS
jgi:hypothetical protein